MLFVYKMFGPNSPLYLRMQIAHFRPHVISLRNVLLSKYLHIKESTPKSTITWSEMGTTNNEGKEVYYRIPCK